MGDNRLIRAKNTVHMFSLKTLSIQILNLHFFGVFNCRNTQQQQQQECGGRDTKKKKNRNEQIAIFVNLDILPSWRSSVRAGGSDFSTAKRLQKRR